MGNLGKLAKALQGVRAAQPRKGEQLINEIAAIAQVAPDEVEKFFYAHDYTLVFLKQVVLQGAKLDQDSIEKTIAEGILPPRLLKDFDIILEKPWKDCLSGIPYYIGFYLVYPFVWIAYWLWQGAMQAKEEVRD